MILVTGVTNFVGRAVVRRLVKERHEVRCLLRPSRYEQRLPRGVDLSTVSASVSDASALCGAMQDVTAVVHLMRDEESAQEGKLRDHAGGTNNLIAAAQAAGVRRFIYLSRLEAGQASAYRLFRIRGRAETAVRESGLEYTILQSAVIYGPEDAFTNALVMLAKMIPIVIPIPAAGLVRFQPLWIGDLSTCVAATLDRDDLIGRTLPVGGPEHFTLEQMIGQILEAAGMRRRLLYVGMPLMRAMIGLFDTLLVHNPTPAWWLDLAAVGSAAELGAVPRRFGFEPRRFAQCLGYLRRRKPWRRDFVRFALGYSSHIRRLPNRKPASVDAPRRA